MSACRGRAEAVVPGLERRECDPETMPMDGHAGVRGLHDLAVAIKPYVVLIGRWYANGLFAIRYDGMSPAQLGV
jgi:hypothetical protein